jgi:hypothetical protein
MDNLLPKASFSKRDFCLFTIDAAFAREQQWQNA